MYSQGLLAAIFFAAAALLIVAGAVKLRRPKPTAEALRGVGLPGRHLPARGLGLVEIAVGAAAFVAPAVAAPAVAVLYATFAGFVIYVLARGLPLRSCGCLGETDTEPSRLHVALTALAAGAGVLAAFAPPPTVAELVGAQPLGGALFLIAVGTASYLAYITLALLPEAFFAYRQPVRGDG